MWRDGIWGRWGRLCGGWRSWSCDCQHAVRDDGTSECAYYLSTRLLHLLFMTSARERVSFFSCLLMARLSLATSFSLSSASFSSRASRVAWLSERTRGP